MQCNDPKCAVHGSLKVRGHTIEGIVKSAKARKSVTVERELMQFVHKYERYKKARSRVHAYNPDCIAAKEGDIVRIGETRRISKTKAFAVLEVLKRGNLKFVRDDPKEDEKAEKRKEKKSGEIE